MKVIQCVFCASDKIVEDEKVTKSILDIVDDCPVCGIPSVFILNIPATLSYQCGEVYARSS
jgi:hypothetical protein